MARKKSTAGTRTSPGRKVTKNQSVKQPTAKKKTAKKKAAKKKTTKKKGNKAASSRSPGLGRPRIPGTAELDMFFKRDFGARQIFRFLDVSTIRELEQFSPDEITDRVISPMVQAVQRIRKTLAMANRHLAQDAKFARTFQSTLNR